VRRSATTIDGRLQARVLDILQRQVALLRARNVNDAAALVLDNVTGEVVAYVGNQGEGSSAPFVDGVRAPRQAGSTLKPLLYGLALEERLLTAVSLLDDSPANLVTPGGMYVPQNYDRDFRGPVSVRAALAGSLNVPAVRTLMLVGTERFAGRLRALGFEGVVEPGDYYGFSLALGSADVTLWQLTGAYRALALGGRWSPPRVSPGGGSGGVAVIDPGAAWIVSDILADRGARSATFGLDNPLATRFWTAVKTGTSKDMRDNWCIGYSRTHTVGVWVGNFDGAPMRDVSGVSGAAPAWLEIMQALTAGDVPSGPPSRPRDITAASVRFLPALEPAREDYFLRGTEIPEVALTPPSPAAVRISYPGDGAILAVDGDIPDPVQRVRFVPTQPLDGLLWRLNDEVLQADAGGDVLWRPRPGRFELVLAAPGGGVLDRVRFEVRGGENHRESPR
jgi:penicillin-binding protein 1C